VGNLSSVCKVKGMTTFFRGVGDSALAASSYRSCGSCEFDVW